MREHHERYLERTARALTRAGQRVTPARVLELLVELAIEDERVYDPDTGLPLATLERSVTQAARDPSTAAEPAGRFALPRLLRHLEDAG